MNTVINNKEKNDVCIYAQCLSLFVFMCLITGFSGCVKSSALYVRPSSKTRASRSRVSEDTDNKNKDDSDTVEVQSSSITSSALPPPTLPVHAQSKVKTGTKSNTIAKAGSKTKAKSKPKSVSKRGKLKRIADSYLGVRYKYGGTNRRGLDCSGFVWRVFTQMGKKDFKRVPANIMRRMGRSVSRRSVQQGDLVFFRRGRKVGHVGIYMGKNMFIHASTKRGVTYTSLNNEYFRNKLVCIRRIN